LISFGFCWICFGTFLVEGGVREKKKALIAPSIPFLDHLILRHRITADAASANAVMLSLSLSSPSPI
jgi:hypothetical protein